MKRQYGRNAKEPAYDAEFEVRFMLENEGTVDFYGSTLTLPQERKFASVESVAAYVTKVWDFGPVASVTRGIPVPKVFPRSSDAKAHYNKTRHAIHVPPPRGHSNWAMRELVVLHEMAHAATRDESADHGPKWAGVFVHMCNVVIGPEVGLLLGAAFDNRGMSVQMPKTTIR